MSIEKRQYIRRKSQPLSQGSQGGEVAYRPSGEEAAYKLLVSGFKLGAVYGYVYAEGSPRTKVGFDKGLKALIAWMGTPEADKLIRGIIEKEGY